MSMAPHLVEVAQILAEGLLRLHLQEQRRRIVSRREKRLDVSRESSGHATHQSRNGDEE